MECINDIQVQERNVLQPVCSTVLLSGSCTLISSFHICATREKYLILQLYSFTEHATVHLKFPIKDVIIFMAGSIFKQS